MDNYFHNDVKTSFVVLDSGQERAREGRYSSARRKENGVADLL